MNVNGDRLQSFIVWTFKPNSTVFYPYMEVNLYETSNQVAYKIYSKSIKYEWMNKNIEQIMEGGTMHQW